MRTLIVYATGRGHTRKIAARIADVLESAGHEVRVLDVLEIPSRFDLAGWDMVVAGSSIRFGRHSGALSDFVRTHRAILAERPTAFFSVSGTAIPRSAEGEDAVAERMRAFFHETGWWPDRTACFAGAVPYTRCDPVTRLVLKRMEKRAGRSTDTTRDHEYTDWSAVEGFASELAGMTHPAMNFGAPRSPAGA